MIDAVVGGLGLEPSRDERKRLNKPEGSGFDRGKRVTGTGKRCVAAELKHVWKQGDVIAKYPDHPGQRKRAGMRECENWNTCV